MNLIDHGVRSTNDSLTKTTKYPIFEQDFYDKFHVYYSEWNKGNVDFRLDNKVIMLQNLSWYAEHSIYKTLQLNLVLGIGSRPFNNEIMKEYSWSCPSLIIDYVRVYEWSDQEDVGDIFIQNSGSSVQICNKLNPIKPMKSISSSAIFIIVGTSILLIFIVIAILIYWKKGIKLINRRDVFNTIPFIIIRVIMKYTVTPCVTTIPLLYPVLSKIRVTLK